MKPFFSIIIPALNEENTLPHLMSDLTKQTFSDFEVILVDGHSDDKTVEKAKKFSKYFSFKAIISDKRNVAYQRNLGAKEAQSNWFLFLDADNRIPSYFLQGIKFKTEILDPDILATWILPDGSNSKDKAAALLANFFVDIQKSTSNPFLFEAMMCIKKKSFNKLRGFNSKLKVGEGSNLLKRAKKLNMSFYFVREPKYITSFRRIRKLGHLNVLRGMAQIELARLTNIPLTSQTARQIYPMEGGGFFELNKDNKSALKKIFSRLFLLKE